MNMQYNSENIFNLGYLLSEGLITNHFSNTANLIIDVSENEFKKIDEDLYYRQHSLEENTFTPSQSDIILKFPNVNIIFHKTS